MERKKIVIVGSGPAGISTALSILKASPELNEQMIVLEKQKHPRNKLCGGALTNYADRLLEMLGVNSRVPSFPIYTLRLYLFSKPVDYIHDSSILRIIRRDEFDAELVKTAEENGIEIHEDEEVINIKRENKFLIVETNRNSYLTNIVVGADGSNSVVRKNFVKEKQSRVSKLLEVLIKVDDSASDEFVNNVAVLDFRCVRKNIQGYEWDFPSYIKGVPYLNTGIFDSCVYKGKNINLKSRLLERVKLKNITGEIKIMGHPERWYSANGHYSKNNVVLVGDAAGIEPMFGEGISFALAYGPVAAMAIKQAFNQNNFSFQNYSKLIKENLLGKYLNGRTKSARFFYYPANRKLLPYIISFYQRGVYILQSLQNLLKRAH